MPRRTLELTRVNQDAAYRTVTFYGVSFKHFSYLSSIPCCGPNPNKSWFGLIRFRSPLLTESITLSFPLGTKMFQFPRYVPNHRTMEGDTL